MRPLFLASLSCLLIYTRVLAQHQAPSATPDAPTDVQQPTEPGPTNPLQSGVAMFLTLQKKSVVFPDLATAHGQLSSGNKCELAANDSVAVSTIGGALVGSAVGQARIDRPDTAKNLEGMASASARIWREQLPAICSALVCLRPPHTKIHASS
jgi:hypothetical protein